MIQCCCERGVVHDKHTFMHLDYMCWRCGGTGWLPDDICSSSPGTHPPHPSLSSEPPSPRVDERVEKRNAYELWR